MNDAQIGRNMTAAYGLAARISVAYALIAGVWIYASDTLIAGLTPYVGHATRLQTYKGWLFVAVTALLLYGTIIVAVRRGHWQSPSADDGFALRIISMCRRKANSIARGRSR